jgi:hypothetical protein
MAVDYSFKFTQKAEYKDSIIYIIRLVYSKRDFNEIAKTI